MNIGIMSIRQENPGGVSNVIRGSVSSLLALDQEDVFFQLGDEDGLSLGLSRIQMPFDSRGNQLNFAVLAEDIRIVHSMYSPFHIGSRVPCAKIFTIHDMIPYLHPEWFEQSFFDLYDQEFRRCANESDLVIAVSDSTRKDIIDHFQINPDKVVRIYNGLGDLFENKTADEIRPEKKYVDGEFLLSVSAFDSYKNQNGLIRAFLQYKEHTPDSAIKLVLTGNMRNRGQIEESLIQHPLFEENIVFTGYVSENDLLWLYQNAEAFAYVSLYEGFGLPVLEAMSQGKAVITSDTSSMPEVGGDAVEYCNPANTDSIESALHCLLDHPYRKQELEKRARTQASKFSYRTTAEQLINVYRRFC